MREVPKSGPLVLKGGSADPPDPPPGYGPEMSKLVWQSMKCNSCRGVTIIFIA